MSDPLRDRIRGEMIDALRAGDKERLGAFRLLVAAITNREKEILHELSDDEVREVASKEVKRRTESIEAFEDAGRIELADRERREREILLAYAPAQMSSEEVDAIIDEAVTSSGASGPQDLGRVMGVVMGRAKGRVDGAEVQRRVRERLGA